MYIFGGYFNRWLFFRPNNKWLNVIRQMNENIHKTIQSYYNLLCVDVDVVYLIFSIGLAARLRNAYKIRWYGTWMNEVDMAYEQKGSFIIKSLRLRIVDGKMWSPSKQECSACLHATPNTHPHTHRLTVCLYVIRHLRGRNINFKRTHSFQWTLS